MNINFYSDLGLELQQCNKKGKKGCSNSIKHIIYFNNIKISQFQYGGEEIHFAYHFAGSAFF